MRLLICTQAVDRDDPTLGFFHRWIEEFARHCERVIVICLREGRHSLPGNVAVLSLGKERARGKAPGLFFRAFPRARYVYRFFKYIWKYRRQYDAVFIHMNQVYVLLGGLWWRLWGKRVCLWYAHGAVSSSLRLAERLADAVVTSTPEGFRLQSRKLHVVGQGIDTKHFVECPQTHQSDVIRILCVGRISPVKRCEALIEAARLLCEKGEQFSCTFVGDTGSAGAYYNALKEKIRTHGLDAYVTFAGGVPHERVAEYLCQSDIFVNPSETGSLDKVGLEALAAGVPLITSGEAFTGVFGSYADRLMFQKGDAQALVDRIITVHRAPDRREIIDALAKAVRKEHSLDALIPRILAIYT